MKATKTITAIAVAGMFALPAAAIAQAGGPAGASAQGTGVTGGPPRTGGPGPGQASMGEPQDFTTPAERMRRQQQYGQQQYGGGAQFSDLDRNNDGMITAAEWNAYAAGQGSASAAPAPRRKVRLCIGRLRTNVMIRL